MSNVTILTEDDLKSGVELNSELLFVVENAFRAVAEGAVVAPSKFSLAIAEDRGDVDARAAYIPGLERAAIKIGTDFPGNPRLGLQRRNGLTALLDSETGRVRAVMLDNGYLTAMRAAATGAVAADHLAPADIRTAGVIGAGAQAELQVHALRLVRDFSELVVWARDTGRSEAFALKMRKALNISVRVTTTIEDVVHAADALVTTTRAEKPIIRRNWLRPGIHITAIGSDASHKSELDPRIVAEADRFVCDHNGQSRAIGELRGALADGLLAEDYVADELGEIVAGHKPGRGSDDEITICDLTGMDVHDAAIAAHAYEIAVECGLGFIAED